MGIVKSTDRCYGKLFSYTGTGTNYEENPFIPTTFNIDVNTDGTINSIELDMKGTPLPLASNSSLTHHFIGSSTNSKAFAVEAYYSNYYGHGNYVFGNAPYMGLQSDGWLLRESFFYRSLSSVSEPFYLGAYYNEITQKPMLITYWKHSDMENYMAHQLTSQTFYVGTEENKKLFDQWVLDTFYGTGDSSKYKLVRISPESNIFEVNQSSQLEYGLFYDDNIQLDAEITYTCDAPGTGWGFNAPNILTYYGGADPNHVRVEAIYEGNSYVINPSFIGTGANNPYGEGGNSDIGGGKGNFGYGFFGRPENSDPVGNDVPLGSVENDPAAWGLYTRYLMTGNQLGLFADYLWGGDPDIVIALIKEVIGRIYGDPIQSVINVVSYPFNIALMPGINIRTGNLYWGNIDTDITATRLTTNAVYIDWGTINFDLFWGNFLDYSPHTKIELYLPWGTGLVNIDPGECLPGSLKIITSIELDKGTCVHSVIGNNKSVIGVYEGICGRAIPISSADSSGKALRIATAAVGAAVGAASGIASSISKSDAGFAQQMASKTPDPTRAKAYLDQAKSYSYTASQQAKRGKRAGVLASASGLAAMRSPGHVHRNGSFSGNTQSMTVQYPYVILSRPTQSVPQEYGHHFGYPSNIYRPLGELKGYTEVSSIHLNGILATSEELDELDSILKDGVIF